MLTREQRATMSAMWLGRWNGWQRSGLSMAEYARQEGFDADAAYRWRRVLRRTGHMPETDGTPAASNTKAEEQRKPAVRFARVAVNDTPATRASMVLRLMLANGRRAELQIDGVASLGEVLGVLERVA